MPKQLDRERERETEREQKIRSKERVESNGGWVKAIGEYRK